MSKPLLDDELWERIAPLLPIKRRRFRYPGRKPLDNREALTGILFILKTGIQWEYLRQEMGYGCGMSYWRRLREWQAAGIWQQIHELPLAELQGTDKSDWRRAVVELVSVLLEYGLTVSNKKVSAGFLLLSGPQGLTAHLISALPC